MKTQRILAVVFALVFATTMNVRANVKGGSGISADAKFAYSLRNVQGTSKFVLSFDNLSKETVKIEIYNAANSLVFSETQYSTKTLRKKYDLSELKQGTYTVKITSNTTSFTEDIEIGSNNNSFETVIAPDATDEGKLRVGFANATEAVTVEITDEAGNLIHSETFSDVQNANQLLNMKELGSGVYTITVSSNGKSFTEAYVVE